MQICKNKTTLLNDFNKAAPFYESHAKVQNYLIKTAINNFFPRISNKNSAYKKVIDLGSGPGFLAKKLQSSQYKIYQSDLSFAMCNQAKEHGDAINLNITNLPFKEKSFDLVFSSMVLHWVESWKDAISESYRILRDNGYAYFSIPTDKNFFILKKVLSNLGHNIQQHFLTPLDLTSTLLNEGFSIILDYKENFTLKHSTIKNFIKSLQFMGSNNKSFRYKGFLGKSFFFELKNEYEKQQRECFSQKSYDFDKFIYVDWEIYTILVQK